MQARQFGRIFLSPAAPQDRPWIVLLAIARSAHLLRGTPRATMPPWNFDGWAAAQLFSEISTAGPASTVMPSAETVTLVGPLIVRNRRMR
jgi:hypothetical protein